MSGLPQFKLYDYDSVGALRRRECREDLTKNCLVQVGIPAVLFWSHCHTFLHVVPSPPHTLNIFLFLSSFPELLLSTPPSGLCRLLCEWEVTISVEWQHSDLKRCRNFFFVQNMERGWMESLQQSSTTACQFVQ